jgi:hypothetical protein
LSETLNFCTGYRFGRDWKKIEEHVRTKTAVQVTRITLDDYFPFGDNGNAAMVMLNLMRMCCVQIRSHAQKYFLKVQRLGLAAGLPPQHPSRRLAVTPQPPQSTPIGSGAVATTVLHGHPQQCPAGVVQSPIGWNCPGVLPASNGKRLCL